MGMGLRITTKPRCHKCGYVMHFAYFRTKLKGAVHKTFEHIPGRWYCPKCDRMMKEEV